MTSGVDERGSAEGRSGDAVTARAAVRDAAWRLQGAGIEGARADASLLVAAATGRERADVVARGDVPLGREEAERLEQLVRRRLLREPMAYILGEKEFWSLPFGVGPGVLVPRPDTETVVEAALEAFSDRAAPLALLDLGTGSGCLLLALLSELPRAEGVGVDRSAAALSMASDNAGRLGLAGRARFVRGDWGEPLSGGFDLIVSNPPYIIENEWEGLAPEIQSFEPRDALVGGSDGLDAYRALAPQIARLLKPGGVACIEVGQGQAPAVGGIMSVEHLEMRGARRDLAGIARCLVLRRRSA